ncbi:hypothetical protein EMIT040CA3_10512 [Bacillus pseudomycoides]
MGVSLTCISKKKREVGYISSASLRNNESFSHHTRNGSK